MIWQLVARPAMTIDSMAFSLGTGSAPGMPRQTGQTLVLGSSSWERRQLQNILVSSVVSSVWTSRPITASQSLRTSASFFMRAHLPSRQTRAQRGPRIRRRTARRTARSRAQT